MDPNAQLYILNNLISYISVKVIFIYWTKITHNNQINGVTHHHPKWIIIITEY